MSQVPAVTPAVIELSRALAPHFPWEPAVGDTFWCAGTLRMVWQLPAPCHHADFRILGLYEVKGWLRERGFQVIEIENHGNEWRVTATAHPSATVQSAVGAGDVEAALRLVLGILGEAP